jgi:transmembrane sensor
MDTKKAQELLDKHRAHALTPEEKALLDSWYNELSAGQPPAELPADLHIKQKQDFSYIKHALNRRTIRLWPRLGVAAAILIAVTAGGYFLTHKPVVPVPGGQTALVGDIAPGQNRATLTLANGQKIILSPKMMGQVARQGQTSITANSGQLVYTSGTGDQQISYNNISTGHGEQSPFPVVLTDGTKVWLNSESAITFPTVFNTKERVVKLTGEAYFEVKHNASQPFKVEAGGQVIEDIGTEFNIAAYPDEQATKTTLVKGSVKVGAFKLTPGQQTDGRKLSRVNTARFTAWKDGDFYFDNDPITTVMRELGRWYDIDVSYEGPVSQEGFNAVLSRQKNISVILRGLEKTKGVHFKIEGRRIIVTR